MVLMSVRSHPGGVNEAYHDGLLVHEDVVEGEYCDHIYFTTLV